MKIFILALALALLSPSTTTLASSAGSCLPTCKEGSLKRGGGNPGGAVFVCRKGRWEVLIDCCAGESCVSDPIATCTWAKAFAEDAVGAIASFEISPELVAADIEKKAAAASTAPADNKDTNVAEGETADLFVGSANTKKNTHTHTHTATTFIITMKCLTIILALAGVSVLASPAPQDRANIRCGHCDPGGVVQELRTNPGKCTAFEKNANWSNSTRTNFHCHIYMFFKDNDCKDMDFTWAAAGSLSFGAGKFNSYFCAA